MFSWGFRELRVFFLFCRTFSGYFSGGEIKKMGATKKIEKEKMKNRYNQSFDGIYEYAVGTVKLAIKNCIYSYIKISCLSKHQTITPLRVSIFRFTKKV